jgi:hypothetical protein
MSEIEGRPCGYCGKPLFRKVFPSGRREEIRVFAKRRACSNVCGLRLWKLEMREDLIRASLRFDQPDACWEWQGSMTPAGYGRLGVEWETIQAHRYIYERLVGPIPEGLTIDHLCKNTRCVNPRHLEPVTAGVNTLRGDGPSGQNLRKTHCMRGHEFTPENIRRTSRGGRGCIACFREYDARWKRTWREQNRDLSRAKERARGSEKRLRAKERQEAKEAMI